MKRILFFSLIMLVPLGFAFSQPTISGFTPANGGVGTLVSITGTGLAGATEIRIGGVMAVPVRNTGSLLMALVMPGSTTGLVSVTTPLGNAAAVELFTVREIEAPRIQQDSLLAGVDLVGLASLGNGVALSADGNTMLIGASNDGFDRRGAAVVFVRSGGRWTQQGSKLVGAASSAQARLGWSVALSADGNTALVGGIGDSANKGATWVFVRNAGAWRQQGPKLVGAGAIGNATQGLSVALSADGNTALVGGPNDDGGVGATWVFVRNDTTWSQQGSKLVGSGAVGGAAQGSTVALSADGNTALIGGPNDDLAIGSAWFFTRSGSSWAQVGSKLLVTGAIGIAAVGTSVALSADGKTALLGGYSDDSGLGAAWVFTHEGGVWSQQGGKLFNPNTLYGEQGKSVALRADGNVALVSSPTANLGTGAVLVFSRTGLLWASSGAYLAGTGATGVQTQGASVAISADGNITVLGAPTARGNLGSAWVFTPSGTTALEPLRPTLEDDFRFYPNPLRPDQYITLQWSSARGHAEEEYSVNILTPAGKRVYRLNGMLSSANEGALSFHLPASLGLSPGAYLLQLLLRDRIYATRFVLVK